jgi:protein-L-isoaspartate O-methyltransferase
LCNVVFASIRNSVASTKYGTARAPFVAQLITQLSINSRSRFVDVGSGIGLVCLLIALVTGATVYGVELRRELHLIALKMAADVRRECAKEALASGSVCAATLSGCWLMKQ